jgi:hypothetical protein
VGELPEGRTRLRPLLRRDNARFAGGTAINRELGCAAAPQVHCELAQAAQWNVQHAAFFAEHDRRRVFRASLADVFDIVVDPAWRGDLVELMKRLHRIDPALRVETSLLDDLFLISRRRLLIPPVNGGLGTGEK